MVEGTPLLRVQGRNPLESSNLSLSAIFFQITVKYFSSWMVLGLLLIGQAHGAVAKPLRPRRHAVAGAFSAYSEAQSLDGADEPRLNRMGLDLSYRRNLGQFEMGALLGVSLEGRSDGANGSSFSLGPQMDWNILHNLAGEPWVPALRASALLLFESVDGAAAQGVRLGGHGVLKWFPFISPLLIELAAGVTWSRVSSTAAGAQVESRVLRPELIGSVGFYF